MSSLLSDVKDVRYPGRARRRERHYNRYLMLGGLALVLVTACAWPFALAWWVDEAHLLDRIVAQNCHSDLVSPQLTEDRKEVDVADKVMAAVKMGYEYGRESYSRHGTFVAPDSAAHRQLTDELKVNGRDLGTWQREHGFEVGNNFSGRLLYGDKD